ncbi:MAG TPA: carboxypeptidase M32 [Candidatus Thermoplasmatota archaeon]|nr:carboxypeptidase M32 [Candidatus Thermoplasmatota archaeon]
MKESLDFIYKEQKELSHFGGIGALLGWDQMTYMPLKGSEERAEQLSLISRLVHERVTSDTFYNHLQKLRDAGDQLSEKDRIVVTKLHRDVEKARKLPSAFIEKMSKTTSLAFMVWQEAREQNKFSLFRPHLEKIVELEKQYCEYVKLPGHPYNSLLDDYEEGMTVDILRKEFSFLRAQLVEILKKITSSTIYQKQQPVEMKLDVAQQTELCHILLTHMNLPFDRARLDVSTHPFTTSMGDDDVRITTNYEREGFLSSFFSTMHEAGHGLYELGLLKGEYKDSVISDAPSLGMHESQSRFWENMIARSKPFWTFFSPAFQKIAPDSCKGMSNEIWYHAVNQVRPSLIRVESDELTYCLHVILRFELELDLLDGKITVAELPECWNQKVTDFLGITPKTDREGVLQDMHWSGGEFGYFPTYAIGTIYASQLFRQFSKEHAMFQDEIAQGTFTSIANWLSEHVYHYGSLMTADEIIKKTCGEGLNSKVFIAYLKEKYYPLYEV